MSQYTGQRPPRLPFGLDHNFFVAAFVFVGVFVSGYIVSLSGKKIPALETVGQDIESLTLATAYWWGVIYFVTGRKRRTLDELRTENPIAFAIILLGVLVFTGLLVHR